MIEVLKSMLIGLVEGITEWLPISSTGHMLLLNEVIKLDATKEFMDMYMVVIQLGAILAVIILFWAKLCPIKRDLKIDQSICRLWLKIIVATIPIVIGGLFLGDYIEEHLYTPMTIATMLIVYGVLFIVIERRSKNNKTEIGFKMALFIGIAQTLALIPGTSRSGVTIVFALAMGINREEASMFSFFLAIPAMLGASVLKIYKFGFAFTNQETCLLLIGMLTSLVVSLIVIKFLLSYLKKHDFQFFGWYRIILGTLIIGLLL